MRERQYPNNVNIWLSEDHYNQLHKLKDISGITMSSLARIAVEEMLMRLASELHDQAAVAISDPPAQPKMRHRRKAA